MSQIDANSVFLLIIFVLPGFLVYSVSHSLYRQAVQVKEIEVTYKSLLYSAGMYVVLYLIFQMFDYSLYSFANAHLVWTLLIMVVFSGIWGVAIYRIKSDDLLYKFLKKLHLVGVVQPPNLFAAILDPDYQPRAKNGYWIIFKKDGKHFEGFVAYIDLKLADKLAYVTELRELDENGASLGELPSNYGMILDLTKIEGLEVIYCD